MAKYYGLVSGLPDLVVDAQRLPFTQEEFYLDLLDELSSKDRELLEWLRLEAVGPELIALYQEGHIAPPDDEDEPLQLDEESDEDIALEQRTSLPVKELRRVAYMARRGTPLRRSELLPGYMIRFVNDLYMPRPEDEERVETREQGLSLEDRLSGLYYEAAARSKNAFVAEWFRLNQTLRNVLTVFTCRKLGWRADQYVVGNSEIETQLLTSKARDFDLAEEVPYIHQLIQIAEETDIARRERMIDVLRWRWLDEYTFARVFDIENVLSYYIRLGIVERWLRLDEQTGEETFRQIVMGLKAESNASLQEFKNNTTKR